MEIAPGIHLIPGTVGARPLQLILLRGDVRTVLLDTGAATDPEKTIFPYLASIGLRPTDVDLVITTHSDADHCGGNAAMKRANPRVLITCGEADRPLVEDPAVMFARRYNAYAAKHGIILDDSVRQWLAEMSGEAQPVDWTWSGGETLRLGRDWVVEIHHTPGHSPGHLTIFDPPGRAALMGDTVHGGIGRDASDNPVFPTYTHVDTYLGTITYLRQLDMKLLVGCHWPILRDAEIAAFLDESEQYVRLLDRALLNELARRADGATLQELIYTVGPHLNGGRSIFELELAYTFAGNLQCLVAQGKVTEDDMRHPVRYRLG